MVGGAVGVGAAGGALVGHRLSMPRELGGKRRNGPRVGLRCMCVTWQSLPPLLQAWVPFTVQAVSAPLLICRLTNMPQCPPALLVRSVLLHPLDVVLCHQHSGFPKQTLSFSRYLRMAQVTVLSPGMFAVRRGRCFVTADPPPCLLLCYHCCVLSNMCVICLLHD